MDLSPQTLFPPPADTLEALSAGRNARWWLTEFRPGTLFHLLTVAGFILPIVVIIAQGRRWRGTERGERLRIGWACFVLACQVPILAYWFSPGVFRMSVSLPLHFCDVGVPLAGAAMILRVRTLRTLLYFWGFGLCTQAFITPTVPKGIADPWYWVFFVSHTQIVGSAAYDVSVERYRPTLRDYGVCCAITACYLSFLIGFDALTGFNYGYFGNVVPDAPTSIDRIGPWPQRLFVLAVIVAAAFALLWAIWPLAALLARSRASGAPRR